MLRIRTNIGTARVVTICHGDQWITLATGREGKTTGSLLEAGQNHLMAARALYLQQQEYEHRMKNPHIPMPGETWRG